MAAVLFIVWIFMSAGVADMANTRGRERWSYFFLSMLFSPLLMLLVVGLSPDLAAKERVQKEAAVELERQQWLQQEEEAEIRTAKFAEQAKINQTADPTALVDKLVGIRRLHDSKILDVAEFRARKQEVFDGLSRLDIVQAHDEFLLHFVPLFENQTLNEEDMKCLKKLVYSRG